MTAPNGPPLPARIESIDKRMASLINVSFSPISSNIYNQSINNKWNRKIYYLLLISKLRLTDLEMI